MPHNTVPHFWPLGSPRRLRSLLALLALTCLVLSSAACSGSGDDAAGGPTSSGGLSDATVSLALLSDPTSLDPQLTSQNAVQIPGTQMFEGLYAFDRTQIPQLMLASKVDIEGQGKKYTFTLRDVTFQNGKKLSGADVVASLERAIRIPGSPAAQLKDALVSMTTPAPNTVVLEFKQPLGSVPAILAAYQSVILPAESVKGVGLTPVSRDKLIGTGPYQLNDWQPGKVIQLVRYDGYKPNDAAASGNAGSKVAKIKTLEFVPVTDPGSRLSGLRTGQYQWADQMTADLYDTLKSDKTVVMNLSPAGFTVLYFNHQAGPTTNVLLRRAVQVALDQQPIALTQGPSETWKLTPELPTSKAPFASKVGTENFNVHDTAKAKDLLKQAGYHGEELVLLSTAGSPTGKAMIVVAEQLKAIGMNIKLEEKDLVTGQKIRAQKTGWAMAGGLEGGQIPDVTQLPDLTCGNGQGGYCSDKMNAAIDQFGQALTKQDQQRAHDAVQSVYYGDVVSVKLVEIYRIILTSPKLKGYDGNAYPHFWNVSVSK
jgi:peptide/nickel transport system substrate-binding protein